MAGEGRTQDGWYGEVPAEFPVTEADRAEWAKWAGGTLEDADDEAANPYRRLPERVAPEDTVGEVDTSAPPFDPTSDPNREVGNHWGAGLVV